MKRRNWTAKKKADIVIQGLKGKSVGDICQEHQISQAQYYQWRDHFLSHRGAAFETTKTSRKEQQILQENSQLKTCVAELTLEVKKSEW